MQTQLQIRLLNMKSRQKKRAFQAIPEKPQYAPSRTRTCNRLIRSQELYPIEPWVHRIRRRELSHQIPI